MGKYDPNKFKKDLQDLNKLYKELKRSPIDASAFQKGAKGAEQIAIYLREARAEVAELNEGFSDISQLIVNIGKQFEKGFNDPVKEGTKSFKTLKSLASQLEDDLEGVIDLEKKQLVAIKKRALAEQTNQDRIRKSLKDRIDLGEKLVGKEKDLYEELSKGVDVNQIIIDQAEKRIKAEEKIAKTAGVTGALFNSLSKTLGKIGIGSEFFEDGKKNIREAAKSGSKLKVVGAGLKSIFEGIGQALSDPVVVFGLLTKAFTGLLKLGQKFSQFTADIGKAFLGIQDGAKGTSTALKEIATGDLFLSFDEARTALLDMNEAAGTQVMLSEKQIKAYQQYSHFLGLSKEASQGLFKTATLSGKSFDQIASQIGGVVTGLNLSNDTSLNLNDIINDVATASAETSFNLRNNPDALAKAAFNAKRLGMTMDQITAAAKSTLDFESSIQNEMEAELLLGKNLNLEQLRYAALTGNVDLQAKELNRILADNIDQTEGNVIKQEALAKSLGMSVEDMLKANRARLLQNELSKKGIKDREKAEQALAILEKQGLSREEALAQLSANNLDKTIKQGKEAESSMRMLQQAKETLMVSIAPIAEKVSKGLAAVAQSEGFKKALEGIGKIVKLIADNPLKSLGVVGALGVGIKLLKGGKLGSASNPMAVYLSKAGALGKTFNKIFGKSSGKTALAKATAKGLSTKQIAAGFGGKEAKDQLAKQGGKIAGKNIGKLGAKSLGKSLLKKIPGVGLLAGVGFGLQRALKGDFAGAALELASGAASTIPGLGTAASVALDAGLAARDISKASSGGTAADFISRPGQPIQKFRKDDIIIGGTNLGGGNGEVISLLKELVSAVKEGGDVFIDGNKVGKSLALATSNMG